MKGVIIIIVRTFINFDEPLTEEEEAEIRALKDRPIVYDEDCPPMTDEEVEELRYLMDKYKTRRITKEIFIAEGKIRPTATN